MPTYRSSSRNQLRTPLGAVGDPPDVPGYLATFADDIDNYLGRGGAEDAATTTARDAIPAGRNYTDKRVRVTADGITYIWTGSAWSPYSSQWTNYTPTYTGFTLGNGTATHYYKLVEGVCFVYANVTLGTTSAFTGTFLDVGLPFPTVSGTFMVSEGQLIGATVIDGVAVPGTGQNARLRFRQVSGTNITQTNLSSTAPFTWASGNSWNFTAAYRV